MESLPSARRHGNQLMATLWERVRAIALSCEAGPTAWCMDSCQRAVVAEDKECRAWVAAPSSTPATAMLSRTLRMTGSSTFGLQGLKDAVPARGTTVSRIAAVRVPGIRPEDVIPLAYSSPSS